MSIDTDRNLQVEPLVYHARRNYDLGRLCAEEKGMLKALFTGILFCTAVAGLPAQAPRAAAVQPEKLELRDGWKLSSAKDVPETGAVISTPEYQPVSWHVVKQMPSTVLEALQEDGTYTNLYVGTNLLTEVPQDLYRQDWWYRTSFEAPAGEEVYELQFPGINYRAEIWLNGNLVANNQQVVGMYDAHTLEVSRWIKPGQTNVLAVKVTPERLIQDVDGVELADSWFDWINWKYFGYKGPLKPGMNPPSWVPDRNAGIWKPVYLTASGPVTVSDPAVNTELPLPRINTAKLTIYAELHNVSSRKVDGILRGTISRAGKTNIQIEQPVSLAAGDTREVSFDPQQFAQLNVDHPDLWWPYTMGTPNLYQLELQFVADGHVSDTAHTKFGIRSVTQHRDQDEQFSSIGKGGNFYLQVNGRNFLIRGADYTPDVLYRYDTQRDADMIRYVKDMGLNMLRWESKIASEHMVELADEAGVPVMFGWMCCNQWEKWPEWSAEDHRVAGESLHSQILMLRPHASVFIWANGSDGLPPKPVLNSYHQILKDLHWQNAVVDTVSSFAKDANGEREWSGIHMEGPYSWRPPTYWMSGLYAPTRGACAEQGDNEHIPPVESLKKFIPADKLWPINETWYVHAGSIEGNGTLADVQKAIDHRYGPAANAEDLSRKAQLAHYENTRAQFEDFAANGWANHKMTMYWMLSSPWPSFFGQLFDYYLKPGGSYYGAKKGLRPLSVVFDSYAKGDHSTANFTLVNQTPQDQGPLSARVRVYDLNGKMREDRTVHDLSVPSGGTTPVLSLPRLPDLTPVYFVRCQLLDSAAHVITENDYWQSTTDDDLGPSSNDKQFDLNQVSWANMTALNTMPRVPLTVSASRNRVNGEESVTIRLKNETPHVAFFERAELTKKAGGEEILPVEYDDNYITVFPGEQATIEGRVLHSGSSPEWVRVTGYNTPAQTVPIR